MNDSHKRGNIWSFYLFIYLFCHPLYLGRWEQPCGMWLKNFEERICNDCEIASCPTTRYSSKSFKMVCLGQRLEIIGRSFQSGPICFSAFHVCFNADLIHKVWYNPVTVKRISGGSSDVDDVCLTCICSMACWRNLHGSNWFSQQPPWYPGIPFHDFTNDLPLNQH